MFLLYSLKEKEGKKGLQQIQYISNDLKEPLFFYWGFFFFHLSPNLAFWGFQMWRAELSNKSRKTKPFRGKCSRQCLKDVFKACFLPRPKRCKSRNK